MDMVSSLLAFGFYSRMRASGTKRYVPSGLTESSVLATLTSPHDIWPGSSGSLVPDCQLRLVGEGGEDVSEYDEAGEVLFKSPNLFVGYVGDAEATKNTFDENGWLRTGDVGVMRVGPNGTEHLFIRDRLKDMIKVKVGATRGFLFIPICFANQEGLVQGMQVVPVDIETVLLAHPAVVEVAVIGVPDEFAGERPRAFIVRSESVMADLDGEDLRDSIDDQVESKLHETHWLNGRIDFIAAIPKNQNGKVLKRELRAMVAAE
jgi:acyl-CoA synthetase (AMP-forming)/AMP-acid ligase II